LSLLLVLVTIVTAQKTASLADLDESVVIGTAPIPASVATAPGPAATTSQQQTQQQNQQPRCGEPDALPSLFEIACGGSTATETDTTDSSNSASNSNYERSFDPVFDIFCEVAQEIDLADALAGVDETRFTLFAPTNEAFTNLPEATGYANILGFLLSQQGQLTLETILLNHFVVNHIITPQEVKCDAVTDTFSGSSVTKCASIVGPIFQVGPGNKNGLFLPKYSGGLSSEPIVACNGIMYIMDNVILPDITYDWTPTPTARPTAGPTPIPTNAPTKAPTQPPTSSPTAKASASPTADVLTSLLRGNLPVIPVADASIVKSRTTVKSRMDETDGTGDVDGLKKKENTCGQQGAQLSILSYICWMGNFSLLCSAFQRTGLDELFEGMNQQYDTDNDGIADVITVYAPVNAGMEDVGLTQETIQTMDVYQLRNILKTHITNGFISTQELVCDSHQPTVLGGASQTKIECVDIDGMLTKSMMGFFNIDATKRPIILSPTDIELCNGYVQPIDHVIQMNQIDIDPDP